MGGNAVALHWQIGTGSIEFEGKAQQLPNEPKPDVRLALIIDNEWSDALGDGTCAGMVRASFCCAPSNA